jgi:hypothetical protein
MFAKNLLRVELVSKAAANDIEGVRGMLSRSVEEALQEKSGPRVSAETRNDLGQSLLSIAAQHDHYELSLFLLTYCKSYESRLEYIDEGDEELVMTRKVFNAKPNSRDLKGWSCVCVAVFHHSLRVLRLLLEHGGDPSIRSSYNKNAWDLAKDEVDAAEHVVKSKADIRHVLLEFFSEGDGVKASKKPTPNLYEGLEDNGSAMVMNIEMNSALVNELKDQGAVKKTKKAAPKAGKKGETIKAPKKK